MSGKFVIVAWPEVQDLMECEGFEENSCLINDGALCEEYGSSAYFVNEDWLEKAEPVKEFKEEYFKEESKEEKDDEELYDSVCEVLTWYEHPEESPYNESENFHKDMAEEMYCVLVNVQRYLKS